MNIKYLLKWTIFFITTVQPSIELYATTVFYISTYSSPERNKSAIFLVSSLKNLIDLLNEAEMVNEYAIDFKMVIYCIGFKLKTLLPIKYRKISDDAFMNRAYFLENNQRSLRLVTLNAFTKGHCKEPRVETINVFDKASLVWKNKLKIQTKFKNFNGCLMVYQLNSFYLNVNFFLKDDIHYGFEIEFFEMMAKRGNFVPFFQVLYEGVRDSSYIISAYQNYTFLIDIDFVLTITSKFGFYEDFHVTTTFLDQEEIFVFSPTEAYNSYEKMILPFDEMTWTYLILTFSCAFLFIFIMNYASKKIRSMIYGENVNTPAFNVVSIFFGIGQTRLPLENFSRIILMIFIIFCLIIRTAYQGVQFDMMTKDMRKPIPKTIADLVDMGYTTYFINDSEFLSIPAFER
jgi:hypothetical protein